MNKLKLYTCKGYNMLGLYIDGNGVIYLDPEKAIALIDALQEWLSTIEDSDEEEDLGKTGY
jgi:hypothetical protein